MTGGNGVGRTPRPEQALSDGLLEALGAHRITTRVRRESGYELVAESVRPGLRSMFDEPEQDGPAETWRHVARTGVPLVQRDCLAEAPRAPRHVLDEYDVRAQVLWPVHDARGLVAVVSVHHCAEPRTWTVDDLRLIEGYARSVADLLGVAGPDLAGRVETLEKTEQARALWVSFGRAMDSGGATGEAYSPAKMAALTAEDGVTVLDGDVYQGLATMVPMWSQLRQTLCLHYMSNPEIEIDEDGRHARAEWHMWEAPVLDGEAVLGAFTHQHEYVLTDEGWRCGRVSQRAHVFQTWRRSWADRPLLPSMESTGAGHD